jgi:predicted LPLAT superfamily acyltransferase
MASTVSTWTQRRERGSLPLVRFMAWLSLRIGRAPSRLLLRAIAAYFLVAGARARRASALFLERCNGREPTWRELYRVFFSFAATIHDRIYFLKGRFDLFDIQVHGAQHLPDGGAVLMGAHLGSFEALRACGRTMGHRRVAMAMYEGTARRLNGVLASIAPDAMSDIVTLGRIDSMLELRSLLDAGTLVGFLADRTPGDEAAITVPFMGAPAPFPTGPMRLAAALRQPVVFMAGLYRGGNRYEIRFEPLADFARLEGLSRAQREARIEEAVAAYASRLEELARAAPDNWFNFHDFWARPE